MSKQYYGREYFAQKLGPFNYRVWMMDRETGKHYNPSTVRYYRKLSAERAALALLTAYNDGVFIGSDRRYFK